MSADVVSAETTAEAATAVTTATQTVAACRAVPLAAPLQSQLVLLYKLSSAASCDNSSQDTCYGGWPLPVMHYYQKMIMHQKMIMYQNDETRCGI